MGWVYLLVEVDQIGIEKYKIGITKNDPDKRVKQLQTGNADVISLVTKYESEVYHKIEQWMLRKYNDKTEAGNEWRSLSYEQVKSFVDDCKRAEETITFLMKENHFYK
jgi:hypothetical protein